MPAMVSVGTSGQPTHEGDCFVVDGRDRASSTDYPASAGWSRQFEEECLSGPEGGEVADYLPDHVGVMLVQSECLAGGGGDVEAMHPGVSGHQDPEQVVEGVLGQQFRFFGEEQTEPHQATRRCRYAPGRSDGLVAPVLQLRDQ